MKKKLLTLFAFVFLLIAVIGLLRFVIGGSEDTWICSGGQWVKHGSPRAEAPTKPCQ